MKEERCFYCGELVSFEFFICEDGNKIICEDCNITNKFSKNKILPCEKRFDFKYGEHIHRKSFFSGDDMVLKDQSQIVKDFNRSFNKQFKS